MAIEIVVPAIVSLVVALIGILQVPLETRSDLRKLSSLVESAERLSESARPNSYALKSLDTAIRVVAANIEANERRPVKYAVQGKQKASDAADLSMPWWLKALLWIGLVVMLGGAMVGLVAGAIGVEWQEGPLAIAVMGWIMVLLGALLQIGRQRRKKLNGGEVS